MIKEWTFEDEEIPTIGDITLDLDYSYSYDAGKYSGPPEDCYPAEEEFGIALPKDFEAIIDSHMARYRRELVKFFEDKVQDMMFDNLPREWYEKEEREV